MLTLKLLREEPQFVIERLAVKNFNAKESIDNIVSADALRRSHQTQLDAVLADINQKSKSIGGLMKEGKKDEAEGLKSQVADLKLRAKELEAKMEEENVKMNENLVLLPNIPAEQVP